MGSGKFENGAVTGAFGYLFNQAAHRINSHDPSAGDAWTREDVAEIIFHEQKGYDPDDAETLDADKALAATVLDRQDAGIVERLNGTTGTLPGSVEMGNLIKPDEWKNIYSGGRYWAAYNLARQAADWAFDSPDRPLNYLGYQHSKAPITTPFYGYPFIRSYGPLSSQCPSCNNTLNVYGK